MDGLIRTRFQLLMVLGGFRAVFWGGGGAFVFGFAVVEAWVEALGKGAALLAHDLSMVF